MTNVLKNTLFDNPAHDINQMLTGFWEAAGSPFFEEGTPKVASLMSSLRPSKKGLRRLRSFKEGTG